MYGVSQEDGEIKWNAKMEKDAEIYEKKRKKNGDGNRPQNWRDKDHKLGMEEDRPLEIISFQDITLQMSKPLLSQLPLMSGPLGNSRVLWLTITSFP